MTTFLWRIFSFFYGLTEFMLYRSGLKVWLLLVQDTFRLPPVISAVVSIYLITSTTVPQIPVLILHPEFGLRSIHHDLCPKTDFSYFLFPLTEEGGYFRFGVLANHLAFIYFLPPSGDSLGLLYVPVPHSLPIWSLSTNICWFPF